MRFRHGGIPIPEQEYLDRVRAMTEAEVQELIRNSGPRLEMYLDGVLSREEAAAVALWDKETDAAFFAEQRRKHPELYRREPSSEPSTPPASRKQKGL